NDPILFAPAATSGVDNIDFWPGGMAEKPSVFAGLLGSTFNFVFEHQLEMLQAGDRFYYLQRTDGLNFRFSLEGNSLAELAKRNTTVRGTMDNVFNTADFIFDARSTPGVVDPATGISLLALGDGTIQFFDPLHGGKNIVFDGGPGNEKFRGDVGDDTLIGNDGNDRLDGAEGNDTLIGGNGDDVLFGDNGDVFDLLAGLDPVGGDDVLGGGPGQDGHFGEGGDDIMLMSEGSNKFFGDYGFDWVTQRGWQVPADIELDLVAIPGVLLNFNDLRNRYRLVDGASGWDLDDHIRGESRVGEPTVAPERENLPGMGLTTAGAAKMAGLTQLVGP